MFHGSRRRAPGFLTLAMFAACADSGGSEPSRDAEAIDAGWLPDADADTMDAQVAFPDGAPGMMDVQIDATMTDAMAPDGDVFDAGANPTDAGMPIVCSVQAPTSCPSPMPTYGEVAPIFRERCEVCHSPRWTGPWPLDTYGHVADWQDTIRAELIACTMPPPEAGVPMTNEERLQILTWIRCGLPM